MYRTLLIFSFLFITFNISAQFSYRKYAKEDTKVYLISEISLSYPISLGEKSVLRHWDASANLGAMYDLNTKLGLGAHFFYGFYKNGGGHTQYGVRPRIAYYLKNDFQINLSPGVIIADSSFPDGFAGYSVETTFSWNDHIGITVRYDDLVEDRFRKDRYLHIGIQTKGIKGFAIICGSAVTELVNRWRRQN